MAHKKAGGSSRNGRDSESKRLGVKRFGGQLVKAGNITNCQKLGITNVTVTHKIGVLTRDEDVVSEELIIAGKNNAAKLGGDSIVTTSENIEGKIFKSLP